MDSAGVKDHKQAHAKVRAARQKAQDADVKALAATLQPVIDRHWQAAQDLASGKP